MTSLFKWLVKEKTSEDSKEPLWKKSKWLVKYNKRMKEIDAEDARTQRKMGPIQKFFYNKHLKEKKLQHMQGFWIRDLERINRQKASKVDK